MTKSKTNIKKKRQIFNYEKIAIKYFVKTITIHFKSLNKVVDDVSTLTQCHHHRSSQKIIKLFGSKF